MHVRLFQFEDVLVFLQNLFLQPLDFLTVEEYLLLDIVGTEGGASLFDPMIEALHQGDHTFRELRESRLPHSDCRRRELRLE